MSTELLLIGIAEEKGGDASGILKDAGVTKDLILKALLEIRGTQRVTDPNPEEKYQALERYSRDLTDLARQGKLDAAIAQWEEVLKIDPHNKSVAENISKAKEILDDPLK